MVKQSISLVRCNSLNRDFCGLIEGLDADLAERNRAQQSEYDKYNVIEPIDTAVVVQEAFHNVNNG